jgi:hypothetical protein
MKRKFDIPDNFLVDSELVDRMAVYAIKWHYNSIVKDMDDFVLHQRGHPDDYKHNMKMKEHFQAVLEYWGEM